MAASGLPSPHSRSTFWRADANPANSLDPIEDVLVPAIMCTLQSRRSRDKQRYPPFTSTVRLITPSPAAPEGAAPSAGSSSSVPPASACETCRSFLLPHDILPPCSMPGERRFYLCTSCPPSPSSAKMMQVVQMLELCPLYRVTGLLNPKTSILDSPPLFPLLDAELGNISLPLSPFF